MRCTTAFSRGSTSALSPWGLLRSSTYMSMQRAAIRTTLVSGRVKAKVTYSYPVHVLNDACWAYLAKSAHTQSSL